MGTRRRGLAADDRRRLVDELVTFQSVDHEQGEVHAAGAVAGEDWIPHVPAPHWQALALAFLEIASAHNGPPRIAGEDTSAGLDLVVEVCDASKTRERTEHLHERPDL